MRNTQAEATRVQRPVLALIFENIRNMFLCVGLALVGLAMAYLPELSTLGRPWSHWLGVLIILFSVGLLVASVLNLWAELTRGTPIRSAKFGLVIAPLMLTYSVAVMSGYSVATKELAKPILAQVAPHAGAGETKEAPKAGSQ